jgi:hypothetical protein
VQTVGTGDIKAHSDHTKETLGGQIKMIGSREINEFFGVNLWIGGSTRRAVRNFYIKFIYLYKIWLPMRSVDTCWKINRGEGNHFKTH